VGRGNEGGAGCRAVETQGMRRGQQIRNRALPPVLAKDPLETWS